MRPATLLCLALTVASCGIRGEVRVDVNQPTVGITAVITNQTSNDLEMTYMSQGEGHSTEGGGVLPACSVTTLAMPAAPGETWELVITRPEGPVGVISLSTNNRPDLVVPPGRARRLQVDISDDGAVLRRNMVIDPGLADENQGIVEIPGCT